MSKNHESLTSKKNGEISIASTKQCEPCFSTVAEALCELHFRPINKNTTKNQSEAKLHWDPKWFGKMLQDLGGEYDLEPAQMRMMQISSFPGRTPEISEVQSSADRMIYRNKNGIQLYQLSPVLLTINEIGKYPGWLTFSKHIQTGWETFANIVKNFEITRIGLRYINRIPRTSQNANIGHWLSNSDWLPSRLQTQSQDFFFKFDTKINKNKHLKLTIVEEQTQSEIAPLIFDLDVISQDIVLGSWTDISNEINNLHDIIRKEFDASLTQNYRMLIQSNNPKEII